MIARPTTTHDTILLQKVIVDTIRYPSKDSLDLLNKMDTFYNNSWTKLMIVVTAAFAVLGILVPALIQWYQKRELKLSEDRLKKDMQLEFQKALDDFKSQMRQSHKEELSKVQLELTGGLYHVQAFQYYLQKNYTKATRDFFKTLKHYFNSTGNEANIKSALGGLQASLERCTKEKIDKSFSLIDLTFEKAIESLRTWDGNDSYKVEINKLESSYNLIIDNENLQAANALDDLNKENTQSTV